jgi:hypothetical protein
MFTTNQIVELIKKAIDERNQNIKDEAHEHHNESVAADRILENTWEVVTSTFDKLLVKGDHPARVFLIEVKEAM